MYKATKENNDPAHIPIVRDSSITVDAHPVYFLFLTRVGPHIIAKFPRNPLVSANKETITKGKESFLKMTGS